ncbi:MAG: hypothetical protein DRH93_17255 [Deltaproteobacteria bacterium]|nr:MAG: hypothetical protein DRH93_17255 [Deltaproteobacteria bacterium]
MKLAEGLKVIEKGWIVKPKGFRVRYQKRVDSKIVTEYSPRLEDAALDSDVTTWRYAWKLFQATQTVPGEIAEDELVNITVVDELDNPVIYYVTGEKETFNMKDESL